MTDSNKCLYRCWTEKVNGKPQKMQGCIPNGAPSDAKVGDVVNLGKNYQVVNCKWPGCL